jgi:hypothetical protein
LDDRGECSPRRRPAPGKILFMTNRAVGRVLDVRKGWQSRCHVGPVALTDIIRDCHIHIDAMPIDFAEAIAYAATDLPGRVIAAPGSAALQPIPNEMVVTPVSFTAQTSPTVPDVSNLVHFKVVPTASSKGVGVRATSDGGGLKMSLEAFVRLEQPTVSTALTITERNLRQILLTLTALPV